MSLFFAVAVAWVGTTALLGLRATRGLRARLDAQPSLHRADGVWATRGVALSIVDLRIGERDAVIFSRRGGAPIVLLREGEPAPGWGSEGLVVRRVVVERGQLVLEREPRVAAITLQVPDPERAREALERFLAHVPERTPYRCATHDAARAPRFFTLTPAALGHGGAMQRLGWRLVVFLSILGTVTALLHGYAWLRVVHDPAWPAPVSIALGVFFALAALALPVGLLSARALPRALAGPVGWAAYVWLGAIFYLDVSLLVLDLGRIAFEGVALAAVDGAELTNGPAAARVLAGAASALALGLVGLGAARGLGRPIVRRVKVPIAGLPATFDGFRIVQLSDVHVGPVIRRPFVEKLVAEVTALAPDLVAVTGDLVDGSVAELRSEVAPLAGLSAPHGVFFVTGNHEYFSGVDAWSAHVEELGMTALRNRHVVIEKGGERLTLAGIDDAHAPRFGGVTDLDAALRGRDPALPVILLAHQPRSVEHAEKAGVALQISGHTHGGQMQPFGLLVRLDQPFLQGLHRVGSTAVWVSEGTGTWGPPLRVGTRSEISVLELTRG